MGRHLNVAINLYDFEALAQARLNEPAAAYLAGGAADELTLAANAQAWQHLQLLPRVLRPLAGGHTRSTLLGRALAQPVLLAPVAHQALFHPDAERASALAAAGLAAPMVDRLKLTPKVLELAAGYLGSNGISTLLHRHGALAFWDFAAAGPYVDIQMYPSCSEHPLSYKDAVFLSVQEGLGWNAINRDGWKIEGLG